MNRQRYDFLKEEGIINGCWWQGWLSFSTIIHHNITLFPEFRREKLAALLESTELRVCWPHDVRFANWWGIVAYTWANLKFAYDLYQVFWWTKLWLQIVIFMIWFISLMIWGKGYFNWSWKKGNISIN